MGGYFPTDEATYLLEGLFFYHFPMVLQCYNVLAQKRPFRFFNMWIKSAKFIPLVETNYNKNVSGCCLFKFTQKLKMIKHELKMIKH